jgi:hypothetical protein
VELGVGCVYSVGLITLQRSSSEYQVKVRTWLFHCVGPFWGVGTSTRRQRRSGATLTDVQCVFTAARVLCEAGRCIGCVLMFGQRIESSRKLLRSPAYHQECHVMLASIVVLL